eukprot:320977-Chlamydomonas_euryale.AAC.3
MEQVCGGAGKLCDIGYRRRCGEAVRHWIRKKVHGSYATLDTERRELVSEVGDEGSDEGRGPNVQAGGQGGVWIWPSGGCRKPPKGVDRWGLRSALLQEASQREGQVGSRVSFAAGSLGMSGEAFGGGIRISREVGWQPVEVGWLPSRSYEAFQKGRMQCFFSDFLINFFIAYQSTGVEGPVGPWRGSGGSAPGAQKQNVASDSDETF